MLQLLLDCWVNETSSLTTVTSCGWKFSFLPTPILLCENNPFKYDSDKRLCLFWDTCYFYCLHACFVYSLFQLPVFIDRLPWRGNSRFLSSRMPLGLYHWHHLMNIKCFISGHRMYGAQINVCELSHSKGRYVEVFSACQHKDSTFSYLCQNPFMCHHCVSCFDDL